MGGSCWGRFRGAAWKGKGGYGVTAKRSLCKGPGVERSTVQKPRSPAAVGRGCLAEAGEASW